jgi:hypothetical protein
MIAHRDGSRNSDLPLAQNIYDFGDSDIFSIIVDVT